MADTPRAIDPAARAAAAASAEWIRRRAAATRSKFAATPPLDLTPARPTEPEPAPVAPPTPVAPDVDIEPQSPILAAVPEPHPEPDPAPQEAAVPQITPNPPLAGDQIIIDATGLPDDNRLGPLAFDLRGGAPLPAGFDGQPWSLCWPPEVGWWTTAFPPQRGQAEPDGSVRLPAIAPEKVRGRWARLAGMTTGGRHDAAWVIALDEHGGPLGVWATSPARGAALAALVAGPGHRIPEESVWTISAGDRIASPAPEPAANDEEPPAETYVDAW